MYVKFVDLPFICCLISRTSSVLPSSMWGQVRHPCLDYLTYMIECQKYKKQYIGETKRTLRERFTEHRQATNNPSHANATAAVPTHFNLPDHSIKDMKLIPLELQPTNNASRRKAREAYLIEKGQTLTPHGINRRNEH